MENIAMGLFDIKLSELQRAYGSLLSRIQFYQHCDHTQLRSAREAAKNACANGELQLAKCVNGSRNGTMAAILQAQLGYEQQLKSLCLQQAQSMADPAAEEREEKVLAAEQMALFAECCIDQALSIANLALFATLSAMDMQMSCDEQDFKEDFRRL